MMAEPLAAALHGVAKHYHGFTLGPLNLEIPAGSIVGLIGENGAGKTTLLKLLTGVNRPDAGTVELLSATPDDAAVRAKIGVVFEDAYFYESLTPAQVGASLRGIFGQRGMPVISPLCWSSSTCRRKRASKNSAAACG